jgi:SNF2 family DNA or RNA helicase
MPLDAYQETGARWLAETEHNTLYLADEMRVGKTPQCAAGVAYAQAQRVLVACPAIVRGGWLADFRAFCPDPGFAENAALIYSAADVDKITETTRLIVVSHDLLIQGPVFAALYARCMVFGLDVLVLDEAHLLTNREAKRTKFILGPKCTGNEALAGLAKKVWFVSGTPMRRDASDMFPFARMAGIWPKSRTDFINKFCFGYHDGYEYKITGSKNLPTLKRLLDPYVLRRLRTDVGDVNLRIGTLSIEPREMAPLNPILARLQEEEPKYAAKLQDALATGDFSKIDAASVSTVRRLVGLAKVAGMVEIVKDALDADPASKVAVFGIHRDPLRAIRNYLRAYNASLLFGGTAAERRDQMMEKFHRNYKNRVFVANLASAGLGIDLSPADTLYVFEPSWIASDNEQVLSRIINLRQPRAKEVFFVGLAGSIDDAVTRVAARRAEESKLLFSAS